MIRKTQIDTVALDCSSGIGGDGFAIPFNVQLGSQGNDIRINCYDALTQWQSDV